MESRKLWENPIPAFQYLERAIRKRGANSFSRVCYGRIRNKCFKIKEDLFRLAIKNKSFTMREMKHWNKSSKEVVDAPFLETFKIRLYGTLSNLI